VKYGRPGTNSQRAAVMKLGSVQQTGDARLSSLPTGGRREGEDVGKGKPGPRVVSGAGELPKVLVSLSCV